MSRVGQSLAVAAAAVLLGLLPGCATGTATTDNGANVAIRPAIHVTTYHAPPVRMNPAPAPPPPRPPVLEPRAFMDYFSEIAFGSEFGQSDFTIHKWTRSPRIAVLGQPNASDIATLHAVVAELNEIIDSIDLEFTDFGGDITVHFVPEAEFTHLVDNYVYGSNGFFSSRWYGDGAITTGEVLISTTIGDRLLRDHVIREEITQVLGLAQDSHTHPDSIFYQEFSTTTAYSDLDRRIIEMLYRPDITPGMTREQALAILSAQP